MSALLLLAQALVTHAQAAQPFNYSDFKILPIRLPVLLQQHLSAVYADTLFIFGGRNGTTWESDTDTFSMRAWSLDLSQLNLVLSPGKNDIELDHFNASVEWQELDILPPTYGLSTDGRLSCEHQCSTQVGQYLYIATPYLDTSSGHFFRGVYRLDLSQSPPAFSPESEFPDYDLLDVYSSTIDDVCLTSSSDGNSIYFVGGDKQNTGTGADSDFFRFNVNNSTYQELTPMPIPRQSAGCAVSYDNRHVYIFGGKHNCNGDTGCGDSIFGSADISVYSVETQQWSVTAQQLAETKWNLNCISNEYDETIICPGGRSQSAFRDTSIYRIAAEQVTQSIALNVPTTSYGIVTYEFVSNGTDRAFILLVTGGTNGQSEVYDSIQYIVVYNVPTESPTAAPSTAPTFSPTEAPTQPPTAAPTTSPSFSPSVAPSMAPTDSVTPTKVIKFGTVGPKETELFGTDPPDHDQDNNGGGYVWCMIMTVHIAFILPCLCMSL